MAEWVDALDLGSSAAMRKSSSLFGPTKKTFTNQKHKEQKSQTTKFWHHFGTICAEITSKPNGLGNDAGYVFSKFPGVVKKQVMEVMNEKILCNSIKYKKQKGNAEVMLE